VDDEIDGLLLTRYVSGQCTSDEVAAIQRWIAAEPNRERLVAELEAAWDAASRAPYEWGADEGWRRLDAARRDRNRPSIHLMQPSGRPAPAIVMRDSGVPVWRIAAAVVAVIGATLTMWRVMNRRAHDAVDTTATTEVATLRGQRATLRLADGTRVSLGPASHLRYARAFGISSRDVYLDGDAYFEVAHDTAHLFAVHTAHGVICDIGTSFSVHSYAASPLSEVVVSEGQVAFATTPAGIRAPGVLMLHANDYALIDEGKSTMVLHNVHPSDYLGWTEGRLAFHDTPLNEVIAELGRWYDFDVQLADTSIGSRRLTASFTNESLPIVIERIALSLDLREERHGQTVVLHPRHP
jgi:transmembrane sensor